MDGDAALQDMIARCSALEGFAAEVAAEAAPLVEEAARRTARAGTDPEGRPWAPRKKDGGRALANAADHVTAVAVGPRVDIVLTGPEAIHQRGAGKTLPARRVIPDGSAGVPAAITEACATAARTVFQRRMGGT